MRFVGTSKIGRLSAKKGRIYAQIRLPPPLADMIGDIADVFETERDGKRAFLLVTSHYVLDNNMVLQPGEKVVKPDDEKDNDRRLKALESQISELRFLLLLNESTSFNKNRKEDVLNGLGRIRTGDLRHVKATS
jgi:hypothetical protein